MEFNPNKTPVEVIKEDSFGGTYFRDIFSGVNWKWCNNPWKKSNELKKYWLKILFFRLLRCWIE